MQRCSTLALLGRLGVEQAKLSQHRIDRVLCSKVVLQHRVCVAEAKVGEVKAMHAQCHRPTDIARRVGVGRTSVYRILGLVGQ